MKKQAYDGSLDRISDLPQPLLHNIVSFLTQREAVQTSALSKSWRYVWHDYPNFEFRQSWFNGNKEKFLSVLQTTLLRYHDQKLPMQEFSLQMTEFDSESIPLLQKWIPIVLLNMGVKTFYLFSESENSSTYFDLPPVNFKDESSLQKLYLANCKVSQINSVDEIIMFKHLRKLTLKRVHIAEETFQKIMSNCDYVILDNCEVLRNINVNSKFHHDRKDSYFSFFRLPNKMCFPHLKCLFLSNVRLSTNFFDNFSRSFPCLEYLNLNHCNGLKEFQLSSSSINDLTIEGGSSIKATIDAPNIRDFEFSGFSLPSISFTASSTEWKSRISIYNLPLKDLANDYASSSWLLKLNEVLNALSQSKITLHLDESDRKNHQRNEGMEDDINFCGDIYKPLAVVEHLRLGFSFNPEDVNGLFRAFRPKYIGVFFLYPKADDDAETEEKQLTEFLCKVFVTEREKREYFWQQDLEEVIVEATADFDNEEDWYPTSLSELLQNNLDTPGEEEDGKAVRFRLTWREIECSPTPNI